MSPSRTRATITAALVLGSASITTAVAVAPAGAARTPGLLDCARTVQVRPKTFDLACGDGNVGLIKLSWRSFGGATARGAGTLAINGCDPNCAEGKYQKTRVTVVASRIQTVGGKRTYTRIALTGAGGKSAGRYGIDAHGPYDRNNH